MERLVEGVPRRASIQNHRLRIDPKPKQKKTESTTTFQNSFLINLRICEQKIDDFLTKMFHSLINDSNPRVFIH